MDRLWSVRLASAAAGRSLPAFRMAGRAGGLASRLSAQAAAVAARRALATVPAYADFAGSVPARAPAPQWLDALPVTDKKSYIDAYPLAARCRHGVIPVADAELDESSGSSGRPYTWIRGRAELQQVRRRLALLARYVLSVPPSPRTPVPATSRCCCTPPAPDRSPPTPSRSRGDTSVDSRRPPSGADRGAARPVRP
jgi:hypothetical protein